MFIGRTDAEAPIFWLCDVKSWLMGTDAGKDLGQEKGRQRVRWLDSIINTMEMSLSKLQETVEDREAWHAADHGWQRVRHDLATKPQLILKFSLKNRQKSFRQPSLSPKPKLKGPVFVRIQPLHQDHQLRGEGQGCHNGGLWDISNGIACHRYILGSL